MTLANQLVSRWQDDGIAIADGVSIAAVEDFQQKYNVILPSDFHAYLTVINGMGEPFTCDNNMFSFWPIEQIESVADHFPKRTANVIDAKRYFMFSDHSISLPTYAIKLSNNRSDPTPIATVFSDFGAFDLEGFCDSFTDFVRLYLDDPTHLSTCLPTATVERLREDA
ncbi:SMI1/KNR4 family protein [Mariniblastus sp.]|nr:SMI1/KNR4 family protein [Mariniblastus sp.]